MASEGLMGLLMCPACEFPHWAGLQDPIHREVDIYTSFYLLNDKEKKLKKKIK